MGNGQEAAFVMHRPSAYEAGLISTRLQASSEKSMAPHSSTLAWKIPWTEEPDGLQSMGSAECPRVGHD